MRDQLPALEAKPGPCEKARALTRPAFASPVCLPGLSKRAEFDANAAKGRFVKRLGDSRQIAECRRKQHRIIVPGGQHARDAEADQLREYTEDLATSQVDIEKNTVGVVLLNRVDNMVDFRNEAHNLASEATKNQFEIERDEALIFNNKNS
jgi:hypothetical protein